jgi:hypothetical protein
MKLMRESTFHTLIGRALTEPRFRNALLRSPKQAIRRLPLTSREKELIGEVDAPSLEEFARQLWDRLASAQS